jgi:HAD superfamily hydrolase (TIGR01549 family)
MMLNNIKYLLLDLDGTLIHFQIDKFIHQYLQLIQQHFSYLPYAKSVPQWILEGTEEMLSNEGTTTNKNKFLYFFQKKTGMTEEEIWEIFLHFYETDYNNLQRITKPIEGAQTFMEAARVNGYKLIIATQPVFPEIAIRKRLSWAGVDHLPYELITDIETMCASKPHPAYFRQILDILGTENSRCLMVGNDVVMDMAAANVGITTFYLDTGNIYVNEPNADYQGDYGQLAILLDL